MEELADRGELVLPGAGVELQEGSLHEPGGRGVIPRQAEGAVALGARVQIQGRGKGIPRELRAQMEIAGQVPEVEVEGGLVREDPDGIIVDVEPVLHGLDDDRLMWIAHHPVEAGEREALDEGDVRDVQLFKDGPRFPDAREEAEEVGKELKRGKVKFSFGWSGIVGAPREVEGGEREALFVHRVGVERISPHDPGHPDDRVAGPYLFTAFQLEGIAARGDGDLLPEAVIEIEGAAEITVAVGPLHAGAHAPLAFFRFHSSMKPAD